MHTMVFNWLMVLDGLGYPGWSCIYGLEAGER